MTGNRMLLRGPADYWQAGQWNARCDICYRKCKASEMSMAVSLESRNAMVCWTCLDHIQPQDFVKGIPDGNPPPIFITGNSVESDLLSQPRGGSLMTGAPMTGALMTG